jgi:beta-RFAP synthase
VEWGNLRVKVITPSRLHFGIIDLRGDSGRIHGSAGVAIDNPSITMEAEKSDEITAEGHRSKRIISNAKKIINYTGIQGGVKFKVLSDIPEHCGFGSGTQLSLAVISAIKNLYKIDIDLLTGAYVLERSQRSGVGTHLFLHGGFILDGGRKTDEPDIIPPMLFRCDIPENWRFVIGVPEINIRVAGKNENFAFESLEPPPEKLVWKISHTVLLSMLPGILEEDIQVFGSAMTKMDSIFGDYWVKVQGGRYGHPSIYKGVNFLLENGAYGAGQSSWGPAFYGLAHDQNHAEKLSANLEVYFEEEGIPGYSFVSRPQNSGASIVVSGD